MATPTTTTTATAGSPSPEVEAMAIAAETQDLLLSLRQTDAKQQDEVRSKKDELLQKLRAKTRPAPAARPAMLSPSKEKHAMHIPVARAMAHPLLHGKKRMLGQIKKTALAQGADSMAKLFGYKNHHEQQQHLKKEEEARIQFNALKKQQDDAATQASTRDPDDDDEDSDYVDGAPENDEVSNDKEHDEEGDGTDHGLEPALDEDSATQPASADKSPRLESASPAAPLGVHDDVTPLLDTTAKGNDADDDDETDVVQAKPLGRTKRRITALSDDEDGADADDESDDNDDEAAAAAAAQRAKDKAAQFRAMLAAEDANTKQRKRLGQKTSGLVESEAEEEEEDDVLKIGGLGDFGFGVPLASTEADKEREEEAKALTLQDDDLEHIVDELSDDEKDKDADEAFRDDMAARDRDQISEVMRNVREGFGRNRRIFSTGLNNGEARGRFHLNDLVAADGSKQEAARLGLLESDEETANANDNEAEDEEERMERELRDRFLHQPQIYITSSESESEDENDAPKAQETVADVISDDDEREARQMKLFSAKAKINRRMHRMAQLQKAQASDDRHKTKAPVLPTLLDDDMDDSFELVKSLRGPPPPAAPTLKKRTSYSLTSTASSFSRIADTCKMFPTSSTSKAFVFSNSSFATPETSTDAHDEPREKENEAQLNASRKRAAPVVLGATAKKAKTTQGTKAKPPKSALLSALSDYHCN
ncbi:hypothetical protein SDRG_14139 [Saprolegnia diclina VS20]|uniref:DNA replication checkpoint mediator MRC1 domain-containing protein n=1 Tax=Saprolegnia diclina (strain VS20) TaxID=1156394 RepID=T0R7K2_SAPDV|nr:hypothetical protein SDRG_14139 [Saprolegnia diclina VS20]EQC28043.1 hypothetical protein SDRG_14139 [Saprolegnia diclina VS20]|eukprot:XP_008618468.1 hypothetical protein SDRG_14139 [Saprolegnia diclina VS20]